MTAQVQTIDSVLGFEKFWSQTTHKNKAEYTVDYLMSKVLFLLDAAKLDTLKRNQFILSLSQLDLSTIARIVEQLEEFLVDGLAEKDLDTYLFDVINILGDYNNELSMFEEDLSEIEADISAGNEKIL